MDEVCAESESRTGTGCDRPHYGGEKLQRGYTGDDAPFGKGKTVPFYFGGTLRCCNMYGNFDIIMTHHLDHFLRISQLHPPHPHTPRVAVTSPWCPC